MDTSGHYAKESRIMCLSEIIGQIKLLSSSNRKACETARDPTSIVMTQPDDRSIIGQDVDGRSFPHSVPVAWRQVALTVDLRPGIRWGTTEMAGIRSIWSQKNILAGKSQ